MSQSSVAPPPSLPTPRRSKAPLLLGIVLLTLLALGGGGVALFQWSSKAVAGAKTDADAFLADLEKSDYKSARARFAWEASTATSSSRFTEIMQILKQQHGNPIRHTGPNGFYVSSMNGVTFVRLGYTMQFEKGDSPVDIVMKQQGKKWLVYRFNFQL